MHSELSGFKSADFTMHTKMEPFLVAFVSLFGSFSKSLGNPWETLGELLQLFGSLFGDTAKVSKKSPKGDPEASKGVQNDDMTRIS